MPTKMPRVPDSIQVREIPNARFINFVSPPVSLQYDRGGLVQVPLSPQTNNALDVSGFRKISILIGTTKASAAFLYMGTFAHTLAQGYAVPLDSSIHTFDVVAPEMWLTFNGAPPNTVENSYFWIYLSS